MNLVPGLPPYHKFYNFVDVLRNQQIEEDMDCLIGVSGIKGIGKSSFSGGVGRCFVEKYIEPKFSWEKYTAYTLDHVFERIDNLPEYSVIIGDEAVNFALGEDWMRRHNKELKKIFTKVRDKHFIFFFNIPDIWWLDKKYREGMMNFWIHVARKGLAMLSLPNIAPGIEDRWYRGWLQKTFNKKIINYFTPQKLLFKLLSQYPCKWDIFQFPKLPQPIYDLHLQLRNKYSAVKESQEEDLLKLEWKAIPIFNLRNNFPKIAEAIIKAAENGGSMTYEEIVKNFYYNPFTEQPFITLATAQQTHDRFKALLNVSKLK
jgi:hypothetical protein